MLSHTTKTPQAPSTLNTYYQHLRHEATSNLKRGCKKLQSSSICYMTSPQTLTTTPKDQNRP